MYFNEAAGMCFQGWLVATRFQGWYVIDHGELCSVFVHFTISESNSELFSLNYHLSDLLSIQVADIHPEPAL